MEGLALPLTLTLSPALALTLTQTLRLTRLCRQSTHGDTAEAVGRFRLGFVVPRKLWTVSSAVSSRLSGSSACGVRVRLLFATARVHVRLEEASGLPLITVHAGTRSRTACVDDDADVSRLLTAIAFAVPAFKQWMTS